jgi:hypothetical protein
VSVRDERIRQRWWKDARIYDDKLEGACRQLTGGPLALEAVLTEPRQLRHETGERVRQRTHQALRPGENLRVRVEMIAFGQDASSLDSG